MKLSILVPTLSTRKESYDNLRRDILIQCSLLDVIDDVEFLYDATEKPTTVGNKRNWLLSECTGEYCCFFDDDDSPGYNYIKKIFEGIKKNVDCISLRGEMTTNGQNPQLFEHSLKYSEWKTTNNAIKYERYPNHLNAIRTSIAKQFKFPEINFGEDHRWSKSLHESGLLKTEHYVDEVIYYYKYISNK